LDLVDPDTEQIYFGTVFGFGSGFEYESGFKLNPDPKCLFRIRPKVSDPYDSGSRPTTLPLNNAFLANNIKNRL
jgi:hypothetical protein